MPTLINNDWLQNHLDQPMRRKLKRHSPMIQCDSGALFSVQASSHHYCMPKSDTGPYRSVEIFAVNPSKDNLVVLMELSETASDVYGHVPVELVIEMINREGGVE